MCVVQFTSAVEERWVSVSVCGSCLIVNSDWMTSPAPVQTEWSSGNPCHCAGNLKKTQNNTYSNRGVKVLYSTVFLLQETFTCTPLHFLNKTE